MKIKTLLETEGFKYDETAKTYIRVKKIGDKEIKTHVELKRGFVICYVSNYNDCAITEHKEYITRCIESVENRYLCVMPTIIKYDYAGNFKLLN